MTKKVDAQSASNETEAFEMIELAIEDMEVLTRAFELIDSLCHEANTGEEEEEIESTRQILLH